MSANDDDDDNYDDDDDTPPWSDPPVEGLVHVGQEPDCLPHRLLLLGGVHLIEKDGDQDGRPYP